MCVTHVYDVEGDSYISLLCSALYYESKLLHCRLAPARQERLGRLNLLGRRGLTAVIMLEPARQEYMDINMLHSIIRR